MRKLVLYIALGVSFFSCQKVLELDADTKTTKLVVNSLFNEEDEWRVELSRSLSVLDDGDLSFVSNAQVNIFDENNNLLEQLPYGTDYYESALGLKPIPGKKYKVEVSAPNFTAVSAEDFCPLNVPILSIDTSFVTNSFGGKEYTVIINFQDPANSENYYGIEMETSTFRWTYNPSTGLNDTVLDYRGNTFLSTSDPVVDNSGADSYSQILTFKDNLFAGQQKSITFNYSFYNSGISNQFYVRTLRLHSYTEASYNYSKSIEAYQATEDNPFAEPVQVFSNVENGFGIFGGQSSSEIEF